MSGSAVRGTTSRDPRLVSAAIYEREVGASLARVWENVLDWEHLPWLHADSFASIEKHAADDSGWRARVGFAGGGEAEIELVTDRAGGRYVSRTLDGAGAPSEIWTDLRAVGAHATAIRVELLVRPVPTDRLEAIGAGFRALYARLWDEDESMMRAREAALAARSEAALVDRATDRAEGAGGATLPEVVVLGPWEELRPRLPVETRVGGHRFRIVEVDGAPGAHSVVCPHWLGPLDGCPVEDGMITCPWHGYRFDVRTGRSADGRGLRLRPAPAVEIDRGTGRVLLRPAAVPDGGREPDGDRDEEHRR